MFKTRRKTCLVCKHWDRDRPPDGTRPGVSLDHRRCLAARMNKRTRDEWRDPTDSCNQWEEKDPPVRGDD